jgi:hypothetical protein
MKMTPIAQQLRKKLGINEAALRGRVWSLFNLRGYHHNLTRLNASWEIPIARHREAQLSAVDWSPAPRPALESSWKPLQIWTDNCLYQFSAKIATIVTMYPRQWHRLCSLLANSTAASPAAPF